MEGKEAVNHFDQSHGSEIRAAFVIGRVLVDNTETLVYFIDAPKAGRCGTPRTDVRNAVISKNGILLVQIPAPITWPGLIQILTSNLIHIPRQNQRNLVMENSSSSLGL